jgi:LysM repeat protein
MRIENALAGGIEAAVHGLEQVFAQVGDMLGDIAERYGVSASALRDANPGLGERLLPGQAVRLPADGHAAPAAADHAPDTPASRSATYTVRSGDTMSGIAKAHGVSLQALAEANPQLSNMNRIAVGQTLNLPGTAAQPQRAPVAGAAAPAAAGGHAASPDGTPLYRQGDAAWGHTVLGHSRTISQAGCAMTSVAMAISKISGHRIDPGQLDSYLDQHHGYAGDALKWDTAAQAAGLHGG